MVKPMVGSTTEPTIGRDPSSSIGKQKRDPHVAMGDRSTIDLGGDRIQSPSICVVQRNDIDARRLRAAHHDFFIALKPNETAKAAC